MDLVPGRAFATVATPPHIMEAESFRAGLERIYETMQQGLETDEEIAAFYGNIRVFQIKMLSKSLLILEGLDDRGDHVLVAGHYSSVHLVYSKLKLTPEKKRTPIGFSTEVEQQ